MQKQFQAHNVKCTWQCSSHKYLEALQSLLQHLRFPCTLADRQSLHGLDIATLLVAQAILCLHVCVQVDIAVSSPCCRFALLLLALQKWAVDFVVACALLENVAETCVPE